MLKRMPFLLLSLGLIYVSVHLTQAGRHPVIACCHKLFHTQKRFYQRSPQQGFSGFSTYQRLQIVGLEAALRWLLWRPVVPRSSGLSQANSVAKREGFIRVLAYLPSQRLAATFHRAPVCEAKADGVASYRPCRRSGSSCRYLRFSTSLFADELFPRNSHPGLKNIPRHQCTKRRESHLRASRSSFNEELTGSGGPSSQSRPCRCALTFDVGRHNEHRPGAEDETQHAPRAVSRSGRPPFSSCRIEFVTDPRFDSAAQSVLSHRENSSVYTSTDPFVRVASFDSASHTTASFVRGGGSIGRTSNPRLDVFLTRCTGVSRTLAAVYLVKGHRVWVNESLCVTPSRRLHPGDCVTCLLTCSCNGEIPEKVETAETASDICSKSRSGSESGLFTIQNGGQHAVLYDLLSDIGCSTRGALPTQQNSSPNILAHAGHTNDVSRRLFLCSNKKPCIRQGGNGFTGVHLKNSVKESTHLTPASQLQNAQADTASCEKLHEGGMRPRVYRSNPRSGTNAGKANAQWKLDGLRNLRPLCLAPDKRPIRILYEDDYILVLDKPANVLTHPPDLTIRNIAHYNTTGSVVQRLFHYFQSDKQNIPETFRSLVSPSVVEPGRRERLHANARSDVERTRHGEELTLKEPEEHERKGSERAAVFEGLTRLSGNVSRPEGIVHRLDYGTTGILLVAKTFAAAAALREQWKQREVFKGYVGICSPELKARQRIDAPIKRHHLYRGRMHALDSPASSVPLRLQLSAKSSIVSDADERMSVAEKAETDKLPTASTAKEASTLFLPVGGNSDWGLVAAIALTGRTHQVRAHLEYAGHPLVGDRTYGQLRRKTKKKCVAEGMQLSLARPRCANGADAERSTELSKAPLRNSHCLPKTWRQKGYSFLRGGDTTEFRPGVGSAYTSFENCSRNSQGGAFVPSRPLLHAYKLRIRHPATGCEQEFRAPLPPDMELIAEYLNPDWRMQLERIFEGLSQMSSHAP